MKTCHISSSEDETRPAEVPLGYMHYSKWLLVCGMRKGKKMRRCTWYRIDSQCSLREIKLVSVCIKLIHQIFIICDNIILLTNHAVEYKWLICFVAKFYLPPDRTQISPVAYFPWDTVDINQKKYFQGILIHSYHHSSNISYFFIFLFLLHHIRYI